MAMKNIEYALGAIEEKYIDIMYDVQQVIESLKQGGDENDISTLVTILSTLDKVAGLVNSHSNAIGEITNELGDKCEANLVGIMDSLGGLSSITVDGNVLTKKESTRYYASNSTMAKLLDTAPQLVRLSIAQTECKLMGDNLPVDIKLIKSTKLGIKKGK